MIINKKLITQYAAASNTDLLNAGFTVLYRPKTKYPIVPAIISKFNTRTIMGKYHKAKILLREHGSHFDL